MVLRPQVGLGFRCLALSFDFLLPSDRVGAELAPRLVARSALWIIKAFIYSYDPAPLPILSDLQSFLLKIEKVPAPQRRVPFPVELLISNETSCGSRGSSSVSDGEPC